MSRSGESRVTRAARRERFDATGYVGESSVDPVTCNAVAAAAFAGAVTAFATGAAIVAAHHYFGSHAGPESPVEGARIVSDSLDGLISARTGAL
jgi:hypothetical protein